MLFYTFCTLHRFLFDSSTPESWWQHLRSFHVLHNGRRECIEMTCRGMTLSIHAATTVASGGNSHTSSIEWSKYDLHTQHTVSLRCFNEHNFIVIAMLLKTFVCCVSLLEYDLDGFNDASIVVCAEVLSETIRNTFFLMSKKNTSKRNGRLWFWTHWRNFSEVSAAFIYIDFSYISWDFQHRGSVHSWMSQSGPGHPAGTDLREMWSLPPAEVIITSDCFVFLFGLFFCCDAFVFHFSLPQLSVNTTCRLEKLICFC